MVCLVCWWMFRCCCLVLYCFLLVVYCGNVCWLWDFLFLLCDVCLNVWKGSCRLCSIVFCSFGLLVLRFWIWGCFSWSGWGNLWCVFCVCFLVLCLVCWVWVSVVFCRVFCCICVVCWWLLLFLWLDWCFCWMVWDWLDVVVYWYVVDGVGIDVWGLCFWLCFWLVLGYWWLWSFCLDWFVLCWDLVWVL